MARLEFYAVREDIRGLFHFLFEETDVRIFETYSEPDAVLREFRTFSDLCAAFAIGSDPYGRGCAVDLQLWSPSVTKDARIERSELKPTRRRPHKFRHSFFAVGLIRLQLGGRKENMITESFYGHWNEAGARQRSGGNVDAVDWTTLARLSSRVQRHIRNKMAVAKVDRRHILAGAFSDLQNGVELWAGYTRFHAQSPEIQQLR